MMTRVGFGSEQEMMGLQCDYCLGYYLEQDEFFKVLANMVMKKLYLTPSS
jgi:hypothetical protein